MRPLVLVVGYLGVVLSPLALAWLGDRPPRSFWDELATGLGMLAFAVILVEFVLSGRFRAISGRIGMDVTMRFHQLFARTALALALIHPFLYRAPFSPPYPWDVSRQYTLTTEFDGLLFGVLAWLLLPAFVLLGIGRERLGWRYESWRLLHGLGALLIAALLLAHTLDAGRYSQDPLLALLWGGLFLLALATLVWVYLLRPLSQRRRPWRVHGVRAIGLKTWELVLEPEDHPGLNYRAGQFVWLNVGSSPFSLYENPFSISSAPAAGPRLGFVIKELGDFTQTVGDIAPGTRAHVDGPHGNLTVAGRNEPGIALIAGGVGIAPLLGILRQLHLEGDSRPTLLIYGNRVEEQIVDADALAALARAHGTRLEHVLQEPDAAWTGHAGVIDAALIRRVVDAGAARSWLFVLCGPPAMMAPVEEALTDLGVSPGRILSERFKYD